MNTDITVSADDVSLVLDYLAPPPANRGVMGGLVREAEDRLRTHLVAAADAKPADTDNASEREPFPVDGRCTAMVNAPEVRCTGEVRYCESVPSVRDVTVGDDGTVWVSGSSEEITEAAGDHVFECASCLTEYADPAEWDWA